MTSDNQFRISRRKVLAGLGTIGIASAGAGLGTSAYFSDVETYEDNVLTAGSLDLKVDWEEHYFHDAASEKEGLQNAIRRSLDGVANADQYVGFPDPESPLVYIHADDVPVFMDNTTLESYPDENNDRVQDDLLEYDACVDFADTPADLDPRGDDALRTANEDTLIFGDGEMPTGYKPLVSLDDVKPGDFGELTLSFHLCDNPGYVWMQGELLANAENGLTEPESKDPQEDGTSMGELAGSIQTMLWYDENGDNIYQSGNEGEPVAVQIVLDASGSMEGSRNTEAKTAAKTLAQDVLTANPDNRVGVTFFSGDGYDESAQVQLSVGSTDDTDSDTVDAPKDVSEVHGVIDTLPANGSDTAIGEGILTADEDFQNDPDGLQHVMIVITDGENNAGQNPGIAADDVTGTDADDYTDEIFAVGTGGATETSLETFAHPVDDAHVGFAASPAELNQILGQIAQILVGEQVFFRGTLQEMFDVLEQNHGIPLDGNRATAYDEIVNGEVNDGTMEGRDCFVDSTTNMVGFAWWLPVDHANEIQSDSVEFNLGFYTEQCRHNDGSGQAAEPSPTPTQTSTPTPQQ
ncbi:VWA domain-containing protein [Haloplanus sp. GCM10025708]|uniref:vWA domain-containing protein n=1 Tax=Haloferacaceae TaxID=1644056 RepID=UPI003606759B